VVAIHIVNPDENRVSPDFRCRRAISCLVAFGRDHRAVAEDELHPVLSDPQSDPETERLAQPVGGGAHVRVGEFGDYRRLRN